MIVLKKALRSDLHMIHEIQVCAFCALLEKYQDYATSPAAENLERIVQRFEENQTDYYLIRTDNENIGMARVCNFGERCRLSPICILPEYQGHGYAQKAMAKVESFYPKATLWMLDTILQEEKLCYLYEKLGYRKTGKYETIKPGMDIVFYEKRV